MKTLDNSNKFFWWWWWWWWWWGNLPRKKGRKDVTWFQPETEQALENSTQKQKNKQVHTEK